MLTNKDLEFMQIALKEAKSAAKIGEIPVGAVIVKNNKIISKAFNKRETKKNVLAHAEILAINKACKKLKNWRLLGCTIYITLEPCIMCAGAILNSKIERIIYGALSEKKSVFSSLKFLNKDLIPNNLEIIPNVYEKECKFLIQKFFKSLRWYLN